MRTDDRDRAHGGAADQDPNTCPNCGGAFTTVRVPPIAEDNRQRDKLEAHRQKLIDERGALQRCQGCGYVRREKDEIKPAAA
jgi:hypothetical protein